MTTKLVYGLENLNQMGLDKLSRLKKCTACTIGVFDGVHKGHQKIIKTAVNDAKRLNCSSVVITFDPHPLAVIKPDYHPPILTSLPLKVELISELRVDFILVIKFTKEFARISAKKFLNKVLQDKLHIKAIVVGEGFRFGKNAAGDISLLKKFCDQKKIALTIISLVYTPDGKRISSTRIRHLLKEGKLNETKEILGHYPRIVGKVSAGRGDGNLTGYHTANIKTADKSSIPKEGVYSGYLILGKKRLASVINIGPCPTFGVKKQGLEAHILNFQGNLYNREVELEIHQRLRDVKKFSKPSGLAKQIEADINKAREFLK